MRGMGQMQQGTTRYLLWGMTSSSIQLLSLQKRGDKWIVSQQRNQWTRILSRVGGSYRMIVIMKRWRVMQRSFVGSPIFSPPKGFHNNCMPIIQYQIHSPTAFLRPYWAVVSEPILEITLIESIILKINWTFSMFHKVNHQCCGLLRWTVDYCCGQYGLRDYASPLISCFLFALMKRIHFHSTIFWFLWLKKTLYKLCMMAQMEVAVILSLNNWDAHPEGRIIWNFLI